MGEGLPLGSLLRPRARLAFSKDADFIYHPILGVRGLPFIQPVAYPGFSDEGAPMDRRPVEGLRGGGENIALRRGIRCEIVALFHLFKQHICTSIITFFVMKIT